MGDSRAIGPTFDQAKNHNKRFGEFEFEYFGDSDVVNKLYDNYLLQIHLEEPKQRFGEFKFEYFGDSDVVNKLVVKLWKNQKICQRNPI